MQWDIIRSRVSSYFHSCPVLIVSVTSRKNPWLIGLESKNITRSTTECYDSPYEKSIKNTVNMLGISLN